MLFSSLGKKKASGDSEEENSSSQNTGIFPCAIQLYSNKYLDFQKQADDKNNRNHKTTTKFPYASLTYQAVTDATTVSSNPSFGVWDLRYNQNRGVELTSLLLQKVALRSTDTAENDSPMPISILLTVDLSEPKKVYASMKATLDILVQFFASIDDSKEKGDASIIPYFQGGCCTTSIHSLAKATNEFGIAPGKLDSIPPLGSSYPELQISFIIAGILPSSSADAPAPTQSYVEKQAQNFVFYHLHQFAKTTNCALVFTTLDDANDAEEKKTENAPSQGNASNDNSSGGFGNEMNALIKYLNISTTGQNIPAQSSPDNDTGVSSQFHLPNSHDEEVISGVMLRNASCEGHWDAAKDSLDKGLPDKDATPSPQKKGKGDPDLLEDEDSWLGALASKMPKVTSTNSDKTQSKDPSSKKDRSANGSSNDVTKSAKKSKKKKPADGGAAESKDVSSFFENLMKPKK